MTYVPGNFQELSDEATAAGKPITQSVARLLRDNARVALNQASPPAAADAGTGPNGGKAGLWLPERGMCDAGEVENMVLKTSSTAGEFKLGGAGMDNFDGEVEDNENISIANDPTETELFTVTMPNIGVAGKIGFRFDCLLSFDADAIGFSNSNDSFMRIQFVKLNGDDTLAHYEHSTTWGGFPTLAQTSESDGITNDTEFTGIVTGTGGTINIIIRRLNDTSFRVWGTKTAGTITYCNVARLIAWS